MNLLVDIGNSRIKAALAKEGRVIRTVVVQTEADWVNLLKDEPTRILVSSVRSNTQELLSPLKSHFSDPLILNSGMKFPLALSYDTPSTLGMDRLAAAIGANILSEGKPVLSIMTGTCITCDLTVNGQYQGGSISPGITMRLEAMHHYTAKLPRLSASDAFGYPGKSTEGSMQAGAIGGAILEIENRILHLRKEYDNLVVLISGGDASIFESSVNPPIFVVPDLIFVGLNSILEYNA